MTDQPNQMFAYFTAATKKTPAGVSIYRYDADLGRRKLVLAKAIDNKRDARDFAKTLNAEPWNF